MIASQAPQCHPLGTHRVLEPAGAMPQQAWKLDNAPRAGAGEILCDVDVLNVDSASFRQMAGQCNGDADAIAEQILQTVEQRGKQHNPVTGSGGMFVGSVAAVGENLRARIDLRPGERIASLVSLSLTPLKIDRVLRVDVATGQVWIRGQAILFESALWARLPSDVPESVALAALDVAGAPAQVRRLTSPGQRVLVIGADGKSGLLACAQAKLRAGVDGCVVGLVPDGETAGARLLLRAGLVDRLVVADARDALSASEALGAPADLVVNCVNVAGTEMASILCTREGGTIYFFSMSTSFTAAALGAEGAGRDVTMMIGNGYAKGHAEIALQTLRDHPELKAHFTTTYARNPQ